MRRILTTELSVMEYMRDYRDVPHFMELCEQCKNYGNSWLCPPFEYDIDARLSQWKNALIVLCRFDLPKGDNCVECAMSLMRDNRVDLETRLLELENIYGGLAFGFSGECLHCKTCTRIKGTRCIHPERARPAIEAYGFNVVKTLKNLFGIDIEWAKDGILPPTLSIVGALFHNRPQGEITF